MKKLIFFIASLLIFQGQAQRMYVYFESAKSSLPSAEKLRLDSLTQTFEIQFGYRVTLTGHTDSIGNAVYNQQLSERRAESVQRYISAKRKAIVFFKTGMGFYAPAQSNMQEQGRAKNRRCEIVVEKVVPFAKPWQMPVQSYSVKNKSNNKLHTKNGCVVFVERGSFAVQENDTVQILITEYNDPADFIAGGLPMTYSKDSKTYMYQSEQMMKIEAFVKGNPVVLVKLLGLTCPNVDTSNGVRLYEFRAQENNRSTVVPVLVAGRVEEEPSQKGTNISEKSTLPNTTESNSTKVQKNGAEISSQSNDDNKRKQPEKSNALEIIPDTGKTFSLAPDTGKSFNIIPDTGKSFLFECYKYDRELSQSRGSNCPRLDECTVDFCDTASFMRLLDIGLSYGNKPFSISPSIDFMSFEQRYQSLAYDGIDLKCKQHPDSVYSVHVSANKRFFRNELIFKIDPSNKNPEYAAFHGIKWIVKYGLQKQKIEFLNALKISDFRIMTAEEVYGSGKKNEYAIELKSEKSFYRVMAHVQKTKAARKKYIEYSLTYRRKNELLDKSINALQIDRALKEILCLYTMTRHLSETTRMPSKCSGHYERPACYPFTFFERALDNRFKYCPDIDDCVRKYGAPCVPDCLPSWIEYYNTHREELQEKFAAIKKDPGHIWNYYCKRARVDEPDPCGKWEYVDPNGIGNTITYIGLGVYNFDREMAIEKKQVINNPIYLNAQGDTVLNCASHLQSGVQKRACNHDCYTVIPGFNGLMKQNNTEVLTLLPGKENKLFFQKWGKSYSLYLDLRNVSQHNGNVFILKEVSEQVSTLDGLRTELAKKD